MARTYVGLDVRSDQQGLFPYPSGSVDVGNGVRQAYVDVGPRDSAVTFVLLHGNPTWSFLYRRYLERLSKSYRTVAVDHVGFGRSDKPQEPSYYTLERHILNLGTTLKHLGVERAVLVMQDWGGPIGCGWAVRNPGRVAGVVIHNTWAFVKHPPLKLPLLYRFLMMGKRGWRRIVQENGFTELFMRRGVARSLSATEMDAYRAPHPTPEERIGVARMPQLVPETHRPEHESWATMATIEDALPSLADRPALIVWAKKDVAFRKAMLDRWTKLFTDVDGPHLLPEAKHYLQEDAPDEILAHVERWAAAKWPARVPRVSTTSRKAR